MDYRGNLLKLRSEYLDDISESNIKYRLPVGGSEIELNEMIGRELKIEYQERITVYTVEEKQENHFPRNMSWSENNCLTDHFVYLALTPALKVGVTKSPQIPTRWIDQGASAAIIMACTPNRYLAGSIEVFLKDHLSEKTNWRRMLSEEVLNIRKHGGYFVTITY